MTDSGLQDRKVAVLGMHLCGDLSVKAIEAYHHLQADCVFLMPCCQCGVPFNMRHFCVIAVSYHGRGIACFPTSHTPTVPRPPDHRTLFLTRVRPRRP